MSSGRVGRTWGVILASLAVLVIAACGKRAESPAPTASAAASTQPAASVAADPAATAILAYLQGAEVQAENDAQRRELRRALQDLLDQPAQALRTSRYAGAAGEPGQRDLVQMMRGHLVPASPQALDAEWLYTAKDDPQVRAALRDKRDEVDRSLVSGSAPASQSKP